MATIDSLEIIIQSKIDGVNASLDLLVGKINGVARALTAIQGNKGLEKISEAIRGISESAGNVGSKITQSIKPVEGQAKKIARTFEQVAEPFKDIGKGFRIEGTIADVERGIKKYTNELDKARLKEQRLAADGLTDTDKYRDAVADVKQYENVVESLKSQLEEMKALNAKLTPEMQEKFDSGFFDETNKAMDELSENAKRTGEEIRESISVQPDSSLKYNEEAMASTYGEAARNIEDWESATRQFGESAGTAINGLAERAKEATDGVKEKISELEDRFKDVGKDFSFEGNFEQLENEIEKANADLEKLYAQQKRKIELGEVDTKAFATIIHDIQEVINKLEILEASRPEALNRTLQENAEKAELAKERMREFEERLSQLQVPEIKEDNIDILSSKIEKAEERLEELRARLANEIILGNVEEDVDDSGFAKLREQIVLTEKEIEALSTRMAEVGESSAATGLDRLTWALEGISSSAQGVESILSSLVSGIRKIVSAAKEAVSGLLNLKNSIIDVINGNKKSNASFSDNLKTILRYALGIRSLYMLVRKMRAAIKEGFENLAQYSADTNAALTSMSSALYTTKNALAVAFAPIVEAIAPYITYLINLLNAALNAIGRFFAALTGKDFATQAVGVVKDFAGGVSDSGSAAKKAGKELDGYIAGWHEVNNMTSNDNDGGGSGGGGGAGGGLSVEDMFETVALDDAISQFAKRIRELIKAEKWEELGEYIASALNKGMQKIYDVINWNNVGPKITYFIDAFTRTFNSLVDNLDFDLLGRVIGAGVNTIVKSVNLLVDGIDWINLGKKFSEGINGFVKEVDWYEVGRYIGNKIKILNETIYGFVTNLKFEEIGEALADGLNGLGSRIDLSMLTTSVSAALNGALTVALKLAKSINWKELGETIADAINNLFSKFSFSDLAAAINAWAKGILDTVISALKKIEWGTIGKKIGTFLADIDFTKIAKKIGEALWSAINGAVSAYAGMFSKAPIETALLSLVAIPTALKAITASKFVTGIKNLAEGFKLTTMAITGNKSALETLTRKFPSLGKTVDAVRDSFYLLKAGFQDKQFGTGVLAAMENIRNNMTLLQKGIVTAIAGFAEFKVVSGTFKGLTDGTENLVTGILKIGPVVATAGAALTTVLGFPAGLIATGVIGLVGAISGMTSGIAEMEQQARESEEIEALGRTLEDIAERTQEVTQSTRDWIETSREYVDNAGVAEGAMMQDLARKYEELANKKNRTSEETEEMKSITQKLIDQAPELERYYNEQTGLLETTTDNIQAVIEKRMLEYKTIAYQDKITEAYKKQLEQSTALEEAEAGMLYATEKLAEAQEGYQKAVDLSSILDEYNELSNEEGRLYDATGKNSERMEELRRQLEKNGIEADNYAVESQRLKEEMDGFNEVLAKNGDRWKEQIDNYKNAEQTLEDTNKELEGYRTELEGIEAQTRATNERIAEFDWGLQENQQALVDTKNKLKEVGDGFSEEFAKKMVLAGEEMTDSIIQSFTKMKEGTVLSSEELKELFGNIAPGISSKFSTALAEQEPEVQLRVAQFFANIGAGAEVSGEEAKYVFSTIGFEIPQSMADSFSESDSYTQQKITELFAGLANGGQLAAESVMEAFSSFGYEIVNTGLIKAIADLEGDAQKEAIELIMQLPYAVGDQESEIISKLEEITDSSIDKGILKPLENAEGEAYKGSKAIGEASTEGYSDGVYDSMRLVTDAAGEIASVAEAATKDGLDSHSPSRKFKAIGEDTVAGYTGGIGSKLNTVKTALGDVVKTSTNSMNGTDTTFKGIGSGLVSGLTSGVAVSMGLVTVQMAAVMTTLTAQFMNIGNQFSQIGSNISQSLGTGISSSVSAISNAMSGIVNTISSMASSLYSVGRSAGNAFASGFQSIHIPVPHIASSGTSKTKVGDSTIAIPNFNVRWYAAGGFPEDGWFRANHGEIMGKFDNGKSVVANNNQITEGISDAVQKGNREGNTLLRREISVLERQNELLTGILQKETGIDYKDVFKAARKGAMEYFKRTGENGLLI